MCNNKDNMDNKECNPWAVFIGALCIMGCVAYGMRWYEDNYCPNTAVPVKCSK